MSDPTARRGDNVTALLEAMVKSKRGWPKRAMKRFLFRKYRFGVRPQTIDQIIEQLKDNSEIYARPLKKHSNIYLWYVTAKSNIEYEREKEREGKEERERKKT